MKQIVLCKPVIDGVAITVYGVNIICTEICCSLLQNNLSKIIRDFIILVDGICQGIRNRCVNIISIITIFLNVVCTRFTIFISNQRVRRTINNHRSGTVAISQSSNRRGILEPLLNGLHVTIGCIKTFTFNREFCLRDACRVCEVFGCLAVIELVVLGQSIAERYRRVVVTSNIIGDFSGPIASQSVGAGDCELIAAVAVDGIERCFTKIIRLRAVDRREERAAFEAKFITRDRMLVDGDVTITSDSVVRIGVIGKVNVAEQELIVVGAGISGNTIHMSILAGSIFTTGADGILDTRRIKFITIGNALTICTRFSIDPRTPERSIAISLRCTAVQDNGTAIDCQLAFIRCANSITFQALK